jgi:hypothetical protein
LKVKNFSLRTLRLQKISENKNKTNFLINLLFQIFSCYFIIIIIIVFKSENPVSFRIFLKGKISGREGKGKGKRKIFKT